MYTTLETVRQELGMTDPAETEADDKLEDYIVTANARIDQHCGRTFECAVDTTRCYTADDLCGDELHVDADLAQVTTVTNGDGNAIASSEWRPLPRNTTPLYGLRLKSTSVWELGDADSEIEVTGRWAYSVTAPEVIQRAALRLVCYWYDLSNTGFHGARVMGELGRVMVPKDLPAEIVTILGPLKRIST